MPGQGPAPSRLRIVHRSSKGSIRHALRRPPRREGGLRCRTLRRRPARRSRPRARRVGEPRAAADRALRQERRHLRRRLAAVAEPARAAHPGRHPGRGRRGLADRAAVRRRRLVLLQRGPGQALHRGHRGHQRHRRRRPGAGRARWARRRRGQGRGLVQERAEQGRRLVLQPGGRQRRELHRAGRHRARRRQDRPGVRVQGRQERRPGPGRVPARLLRARGPAGLVRLPAGQERQARRQRSGQRAGHARRPAGVPAGGRVHRERRRDRGLHRLRGLRRELPRRTAQGRAGAPDPGARRRRAQPRLRRHLVGRHGAGPPGPALGRAGRDDLAAAERPGVDPRPDRRAQPERPLAADPGGAGDRRGRDEVRHQQPGDAAGEHRAGPRRDPGRRERPASPASATAAPAKKSSGSSPWWIFGVVLVASIGAGLFISYTRGNRGKRS